MEKSIEVLLLSLAILGGPSPANSQLVKTNLNWRNKCEKVTIPICQNLEYNETQFPNLMGNQDQESAAREIHSDYAPLIKVECSPDIKLFLCTMFAPPCTMLENPLPPCFELCESAKSGCEKIMKNFGYTWPNAFRCDKFPMMSRGGVCVARGNQNSVPSQHDLERVRTSTEIPGIPNSYDQMMDFVCPASLSAPKEVDYQLRIGNVIAKDCGAPCSRMFFDSDNISFFRNWIGSWAVFAMLSCIFTLATFCIDTARFPYPQMAIIYLSFCYFVVSLIYVIGFAMDDSVACGQVFDSSEANLKPERLIRQGTEHSTCTVIGMALYFFLMAGALWWVMLTVAWFLQAGLRWGSEALDVKANYFHAAVWVIAAIQTVIVLVLKKFEGDVLSGVCFVGLWDSQSMLRFIIVPYTIYLVVGIIFLIMGFISMIRIRSERRKAGAKTDSFDGFMIRIGIFSVLYIVPAAGLVGLYIFEYQHLDRWLTQWQEDVCRDPVLMKEWQVPCRHPGIQSPFRLDPRPPMWLFMLKYVMIFLVAMFSGTWVWCKKTALTWRHAYVRLFGIYDPRSDV